MKISLLTWSFLKISISISIWTFLKILIREFCKITISIKYRIDWNLAYRTALAIRVYTVELGLFCGYIANISRCHISHSLGRPGYIAIYRTHSAHFYELRMNYGEFCSISHVVVYCNALVNFFIVCDCYITFAM